METLSAYARQFLDQMERPDVDAIDGLSPSISIEQKTTSRSPRSTVGTITEIYDYLRLLFASIGIPHCPNCERAIARQSAEQIVARVMSLTPEDRVMVLAPIVRDAKAGSERDGGWCSTASGRALTASWSISRTIFRWTSRNHTIEL